MFCEIEPMYWPLIAGTPIGGSEQMRVVAGFSASIAP